MLINRCAKFICYDMTDSLAEDWMDRIAESPKLMLEIIKNLRDVHENKLHEIRRMEAGIEQWVHGGRINAVAFEVGEKIEHEILKIIYEEDYKEENICKVKVKILLKKCLEHVKVDAKVWLRGIGLYGAKDGSKFTVNIKVIY